MDYQLLSWILGFYRRSGEVLNDQSLGKGLWPVDMAIGQLVHELIRARKCRRGVEIGAGVGFSTVWLGSAMRYHNGRLTSFEYFPPKVRLLERHLRRFGLDSTVDVIPANYLCFRPLIPLKGEKKFDFVFLDCRKCDYLPALQMFLPYLKKGCLIFADNAVSHREELLVYLMFVRTDKRFVSQLVEIGSGVEVTKKM